MAFYWIQSAYNLSDMLSKHWDHPTVYPMILKLLISRGNVIVIPKEATQEKEKENLFQDPSFKNAIVLKSAPEHSAIANRTNSFFLTLMSVPIIKTIPT